VPGLGPWTAARRSLDRLWAKDETGFPTNTYFPTWRPMREMRRGPYFNTW